MTDEPMTLVSYAQNREDVLLRRALRQVKDAGLRVRDRVVDRPTLHADLKSTLRRRAEPPLRWLIARPRLRAVADRFLPRFPALERRVRAATQAVTAYAAGPPRDPKDISLAARAVLRELYAARSRADPHRGG